MASFVVELWESIFTPGPTPVLLKATNATFAALQLLLFILLLTTYSIHFVVLSILCGGLWWAINWFATELAIHQAQEEAKLKQQQQQQQRRASGSGEGSAADTRPPPSDADDDDTEVDEATPALAAVQAPPPAVPVTATPAHDQTPLLVLVGQEKENSKSALLNSQSVEPAPVTGELKQRLDTSGTHSSASTEDEWERVSEYEKDK
ncbi:hypothetical protein BROUX41_004958 [Berkeleyomyces rouxiae]|uniref:uncharacterized protein n=1 Tax=Berkeleyomyces rouxiae TaxID=2035830 RepID=UPI003B7AF57D